ncbi:hypothetical protein GCM10027259_08600 [Micromonospora palomenae]
MAAAAPRGAGVWSASAAGSVAVRARRAEWARVSGVGLVMAVQAFGWRVEAFDTCDAGGARPVESDGNKNGPRADARGQRTLGGGECAQVSTRCDGIDDMWTSLTHLTR